MQRWLIALGLAAFVPLLSVRAEQEAAGEEKTKTSSGKAPVVAVFRLHGEITESPPDEALSFGGPKPISLKDLIAHLKKASEDASVKAVVILAEGNVPGLGQIEELRQVMAKIKAAGKDIHVHADSLTMREYVLLSGASRVSVVPTAILLITGINAESLHVRGLLDKIGVKPDFLTCGEYKSAAELFMRETPSPAAEKMMNWLVDSLYETQVQLIAKGRGVNAAKARSWIDGGLYTSDKAKAAGLVDAIEHRQEFEALLKSKYGKDVVFEKNYGKKKQPQFDFSSPLAVFKIWGDLLKDTQKPKTDKASVAIVYVDGMIMTGSSQASPFGGSSGAMSTDIRKALDEAARDDSVKAVVLRVDSGGGSAVASEIILDATRRVKAKKPFVVSMGNIAGSGGYYVACGAETIFADEATITGSIGVVSGKLATTEMWKRLGINFKSYKRGESAGLLGSEDIFSPSERAKMQAFMDDIYGVFKDHVVAIRGNRLKKPIDDLAGGRVFTGRQALELGLVDKIGTLQDAIQYIAGEAKLTDYDIRVIPKPKNFIEQLVEELTGEKDNKPGLNLTAGLPAAGRQTSLVDLAMPHLQHLDPQRVRAIRMALERLQLLQQESVILTMPEILITR